MLRSGRRRSDCGRKPALRGCTSGARGREDQASLPRGHLRAANHAGDRALDGQLPDRHVQRGEVFFGPEDRSEKLFLLQKGKARVYRTTQTGGSSPSPWWRRGACLVRWRSRASGWRGPTPRRWSRRWSPLWSGRTWSASCWQKPEVGLRIMWVLSERLRRQEKRLEDVSMKDVRARLASIVVLLVESEGVRAGTGYKIPVHYTHERLGTMIGTNRVAVTRAFRRLQDEGVVGAEAAPDPRR